MYLFTFMCYTLNHRVLTDLENSGSYTEIIIQLKGNHFVFVVVVINLSGKIAIELPQRIQLIVCVLSELCTEEFKPLVYLKNLCED